MISIIIPAYNEEKRIGATLNAYSEFFRDLKKDNNMGEFEILAVLNGCKDNTIGVVKDAKKKYKEIRYLDFERGGKGFAIIEGFKDAIKKNSDLVGFVDADMATTPEAFFDLIKNVKGYDGIIASRGKEGGNIKTSFLRKLTNKGFNFVVRSLLFLPYKDTQCGAKIFRKDSLKEVINDIGLTEWAFDVDLLYKLMKKGFKIKEHPTVWEDKKESKLNITSVPLLMFLSVIRLRLLNSPFKDFIRLYDKMPGWIKFLHRLK